jgi:hypothetical protein
MHKLLDLIEHFNDFFDSDDTIYVATNEDIYVHNINVRNLKIRLLNNGQYIGASDFINCSGRVRILIDEVPVVITNRCKIFAHKKKDLCLEYNVEYDSATQDLITAFAQHVNGKEAIMSEFRQKDIVDFVFGVADNKLFIVSEFDKEFLNVAEFAKPNKIIIRSFDRDYDNMANIYMRSYIEFIDGKLIYDFEFINKDMPVLTVHTFLSGRIMDSEYLNYNYEFFENLFSAPIL